MGVERGVAARAEFFQVRHASSYSIQFRDSRETFVKPDRTSREPQRDKAWRLRICRSRGSQKWGGSGNSPLRLLRSTLDPLQVDCRHSLRLEACSGTDANTKARGGDGWGLERGRGVPRSQVVWVTRLVGMARGRDPCLGAAVGYLPTARGGGILWRPAFVQAG